MSSFKLLFKEFFLVLVDAEVGAEDDGHAGKPAARFPAQRYGKVAQQSH